MKKIILIVAAVLSYFSSFSQNPPSIEWKKIKTPHFELIFPQEITAEAQRAANTLEHVYRFNCKSLGINPKPISLIFYNQSTETNGFAGLRPRRMGWYTTPYQFNDLGISDWISTLSLHEFRHVVQHEKNNTNFTKIAGIFFGQGGQLGFRYSMPLWFFEGDAVYAETVLSNSGRGRIAKFDMPLRTILLSGQKFNYDQACFRLYNKYYPDAYCLGYHIVTDVRRNFDVDVWEKSFNHATKFSFWPYAFSLSLKKFTGKSLAASYETAMQNLTSFWENQIKNTEFTDAKIINIEPKKSWTNYLDPQYLLDGGIITRKASLDEPAFFYKVLPDGKELKLFQTDASIFSTNANKIVWTTTIPDVRWTERDYSDIYLFNFENSQKIKLTNNGKYFAPALSPDGKTIVAVEYTPEMKCRLVLLSAENGTLIKAIENQTNYFFKMPKWSDDGKKIVFTVNNHEGEGIQIYDLEKNVYLQVLAQAWNNISRPVMYKNYILFNAGYTGIDNIYAVNIDNSEVFQITSRKYGAFNPSVSSDGKNIIFQDYTANGYDLAQIQFAPESWKKITAEQNQHANYSQPLVSKEQNGSVVNKKDIPTETYPVKNYSETLNAFNFHSWGIFPAEDNIEFYVMSNNKLNTLAVLGGYDYYFDKKIGEGFVSLKYMKYFPVFDFTASYGSRKETYKISTNPSIYSDDLWDEQNFRFGVSFPLNFSRGIYNTYLTFGTSYLYKDVKNKNYRLTDEIGNGVLNVMNYNLLFSNILNGASKDIEPRFAQALQLVYKHTPFNDKWNGYLFSGIASLYFPGFFSHHSIKLQGMIEQQDPYVSSKAYTWYQFASYVPVPRGYPSLYHYDNLYKFSIDYKFPVCYPNLNLAGLFYLKRIKGGFYYDYLQGKDTKYNDEFKSAGAQLMFEVYFLRIQIPIEIGLRMAYRFDTKYLSDKNEWRFDWFVIGIPFGY